MDNAKLDYANRLTEEIKQLDKTYRFFVDPISKMAIPYREKESMRQTALQWFLTAFAPNKLQLNPKGWFGGEHCEVDIDFINHCAEYWEARLEAKKKELEEL